MDALLHGHLGDRLPRAVGARRVHRDGLPVGLQIIGAPRADRRVLEVGHAFEQATRFGERRPAL